MVSKPVSSDGGIDRLQLLMNKIDYQFNDIHLLVQATTHKSVQHSNNERLEFLGDSVLGLVIANYLFTHFPNCEEGQLTRMRSTIVKGETLAAFARENNLGDFLLLGPGEKKAGGKHRESILEDMVEAIIGAMYIDGGLGVCEHKILAWFGSRLRKLDPSINPKDPKTTLQEWLQAQQRALPEYSVVDIQGKDHNQTFIVKCTTELLPQGVTAKGASRRKAEQAAAQQMLEQLSHD